MVIYQLEYTQSGCLVDGEEYVNVDDVYEVADYYSKERQASITILEDGAPIARIKNY